MQLEDQSNKKQHEDEAITYQKGVINLEQTEETIRFDDTEELEEQGAQDQSASTSTSSVLRFEDENDSDDAETANDDPFSRFSTSTCPPSILNIQTDTLQFARSRLNGLLRKTAIVDHSSIIDGMLNAIERYRVPCFLMTRSVKDRRREIFPFYFSDTFFELFGLERIRSRIIALWQDQSFGTDSIKNFFVAANIAGACYKKEEMFSLMQTSVNWTDLSIRVSTSEVFKLFFSFVFPEKDFKKKLDIAISNLSTKQKSTPYQASIVTSAPSSSSSSAAKTSNSGDFWGNGIFSRFSTIARARKPQLPQSSSSSEQKQPLQPQQVVLSQPDTACTEELMLLVKSGTKQIMKVRFYIQRLKIRTNSFVADKFHRNDDNPEPLMNCKHIYIACCFPQVNNNCERDDYFKRNFSIDFGPMYTC